jgi:sugar/nucleoside kinase (ribokinase family)
MLHTVQMNEEESSVISPERYDEDNLVKQGLALHTRAICLTRGAGGCSLFVNDKKRIRRRDFAAATAGEAVDTTGCGDVFGAAYCAHLVHSGDITGAVGYANDVASLKAGIPGSAELGTISKFRINTGELTGEKK